MQRIDEVDNNMNETDINFDSLNTDSTDGRSNGDSLNVPVDFKPESVQLGAYDDVSGGVQDDEPDEPFDAPETNSEYDDISLPEFAQCMSTTDMHNISCVSKALQLADALLSLNVTVIDFYSELSTKGYVMDAGLRNLLMTVSHVMTSTNETLKKYKGVVEKSVVNDM